MGDAIENVVKELSQEFSSEETTCPDFENEELNSLKPIIGATIQGIYLGAGTAFSFGPYSNVTAWFKLHFDLEDDGWLTIGKIPIGNSYNLANSKPESNRLLPCTEQTPPNVPTFDEKQQMFQRLLYPLSGRVLHRMEMMEMKNETAGGDWEEAENMPFRMIWTDDMVLTFGWGVYDSLREAECENPVLRPIILGDTTLDQMESEASSPGMLTRWKELDGPHVQKRLLKASAGPTSFKLYLEDDWNFEVYNDLGRTIIDVYHEPENPQLHRSASSTASSQNSSDKRSKMP